MSESSDDLTGVAAPPPDPGRSNGQSTTRRENTLRRTCWSVSSSERPQQGRAGPQSPEWSAWHDSAATAPPIAQEGHTTAMTGVENVRSYSNREAPPLFRPGESPRRSARAEPRPGGEHLLRSRSGSREGRFDQHLGRRARVPDQVLLACANRCSDEHAPQEHEQLRREWLGLLRTCRRQEAREPFSHEVLVRRRDIQDSSRAPGRDRRTTAVRGQRPDPARPSGPHSRKFQPSAFSHLLHRRARRERRPDASGVSDFIS